MSGARIWVELSWQGRPVYIEPQSIVAVASDGADKTAITLSTGSSLLVDGDAKGVMARVMLANLRVAEHNSPQIPVGIIRLDAFDEAVEEHGITGDVIEALLGISEPKPEPEKKKPLIPIPFKKKTDNDLN